MGKLVIISSIKWLELNLNVVKSEFSMGNAKYHEENLQSEEESRREGTNAKLSVALDIRRELDMWRGQTLYKSRWQSHWVWLMHFLPLYMQFQDGHRQ